MHTFGHCSVELCILRNNQYVLWEDSKDKGKKIKLSGINIDQTSSRLHKTVTDNDYDYFQFTKEDYHYIFIFASGITITFLIIHFQF